MAKVLTNRFRPSYRTRLFPRPGRLNRTDRKGPKPGLVDITMISASGFRLNCQDSEATVFVVTLEEIDREIANRQVIDVFAEATNDKLIA